MSAWICRELQLQKHVSNILNTIIIYSKGFQFAVWVGLALYYQYLLRSAQINCGDRRLQAFVTSPNFVWKLSNKHPKLRKDPSTWLVQSEKSYSLWFLICNWPRPPGAQLFKKGCMKVFFAGIKFGLFFWITWVYSQHGHFICSHLR